MNQKYVTKKDILRMTGAMPYTVQYLHTCGRLPLAKAPQGQGIPLLFHPDAVKIVQAHLDRTGSNGSRENKRVRGAAH